VKLKYSVSFIALALVGLLVAFIGGPHDVALAQAQQRTADKDRQALLALEDSWLRGEHDAATLERILAADFVHPVATGDLLTKTQHIHYSTKYLPPTGLKQRFDNLTVRLYGDVGIVTGIVITSDEHAKDVDRTIFTDVFAYRDGRWQAINAQENRMEEKPPPK
jgi:hypothetical protein